MQSVVTVFAGTGVLQCRTNMLYTLHGIQCVIAAYGLRGAITCITLAAESLPCVMASPAKT